MEAWALQYNQHLGKTLLVPVEEPKSILDEMIKETILRRLPDIMRTGEGRSKPAKGRDLGLCCVFLYQTVYLI